jgi:hypothetical protein
MTQPPIIDIDAELIRTDSNGERMMFITNCTDIGPDGRPRTWAIYQSPSLYRINGRKARG